GERGDYRLRSRAGLEGAARPDPVGVRREGPPGAGPALDREPPQVAWQGLDDRRPAGRLAWTNRHAQRSAERRGGIRRFRPRPVRRHRPMGARPWAHERQLLTAARLSSESKISSIGRLKVRASEKASGRLGSYFPVSIAFTVWRETPRCSARSACDQ